MLGSLLGIGARRGDDIDRRIVGPKQHEIVDDDRMKTQYAVCVFTDTQAIGTRNRIDPRLRRQRKLPNGAAADIHVARDMVRSF